MRLAVAIDREHVCNWHLRLVDDLRADGHDVVLIPSGRHVRRRRTNGFDRLLERRLYRIPNDHPTARVAPAHRTALFDGAATTDAPADLVIDLADSDLAGRVIAPLFEGSRDEDEAAAAIVEARSPSVGVLYRDGGPGTDRLVAVGAPAITDRGVLLRALDQYAHGAARILRQTIKRIALGRALPAVTEEEAGDRILCRRPASFAARSLSGKVAGRLRRMRDGREHWRIGWRRVDGDGVRDALAWPAAPYRFLPDDGRRYYADPFIFLQDGMTHVFCEEFPYATNRGIISHFTLAADGTPSSPRPVLERPYHLSYPQVFAHEGEIFMIPETTGNRTIELFRAARFPDTWEKVRDLIADHLMGPWTPHPLNPVLLDVRAARPGGHMYYRDGRLLRPAQDCRDGYGAGLTLCEVTRLDPEGYEQRVLARLAPQRSWRAHGTHTLNEAGGFEAIDCLGPQKRFPV